MAGTLAPTTDPNVTLEEGDVNIYYNNELIGSMSENRTAVLKTKDTICEDDIEVEYTKPSGESDFPEFTITNNTSLSRDNITINGSIMRNLNDDAQPWINVPSSLATNFIPGWDSRAHSYKISGIVNAESDNYSITVNGDNLGYDEGDQGYFIDIRIANYNTPVEIVINNKEANNNH